MILGRINVLSVVFYDAANHTVHITECNRRGECTEVQHARYPVLVSVSGYGVITKRAADVAERVMAAGSGFVWTQEGNNVSFMREEQLHVLGEALAGKKIVGIRCGAEDTGAAAQRFFVENVNFRALLRPTAAGSALAQAAAARLKLPVLGIVLLALVVNMVVAPRVKGRNEAAQTELQVLRKSVGQADETSRRRQEMLAEYSGTLPRRISVLCDRVASAVPVGVTLTSLAVQPLSGPLNNNRKAEFAAGRAGIAGRAKIPQQVSKYIASLTALGIARQVQLASMEQNEEMFDFEITLEL
jgi:Tfp pilus assembly protein PilN